MNRPGRPAGPSSDTEATVLTTALELLLTEGAAALVPQRLHAETGVARSTIYRHWPTARHVLEAIIEVAPVRSPPPTGDLARDLHTQVDLLCDRLAGKPVGGVLQALIVAASWDASIVDLRCRYVRDLMTPFETVLRSAGLDEARLTEWVSAITAPLLVDSLLLNLPVPRVRAHRTVDALLAELELT
ncbi:MULTISPECIES: TetR/AcrR family transcriptional regulator C-terminal ligand-binding domain-containing protein [Actinomadura]|uniref:TetR/AcrR family transcriptional regulator C-terminal ligand-binding domain-containing protein n=1 Tax=Actinomadura yumaensis TaxID=111807 RepID=A0ABW2CDA5_9ACTN|nr:TetR/AcrR family transcriptional regulator C-terminal ligand-binding domain-containing protein [Actinomadura sp. J1-007]MWK38395.1 TetR family transcriptional regulator [Actinomadura sp. J1-007]